jgi:hypothetical protein
MIAKEGWPLPFKAHFWVYGYVVYTDHVGNSRKHGFVGLWIPPNVGSAAGDASGASFIWGGNKRYAYNA